MRIKELLSEIGHTSEPVSANIDVSAATEYSQVDGRTVWLLQNSTHAIFLTKDGNKLAAYITIELAMQGDFYPLVRMENVARYPGAVSALVAWFISIGGKLKIQASEPISIHTVSWLTKTINKKSNGLKITDQNGNIPNPADIRAEFESTAASDTYGPTEIFIENRNIRLRPLGENTLLPHLAQWFGDGDLD